MEAAKLAAERPSVIVPASNYKDKYEHLIGKEAAKDAAKLTMANKSYGFGKDKTTLACGGVLCVCACLLLKMSLPFCMYWHCVCVSV